MKPKPKKPRRKFILVEVETTLANGAMSEVARFNLESEVCTVLQVHVNAAVPTPKGRR